MAWFSELTPENVQNRDRYDEFAELILSPTLQNLLIVLRVFAITSKTSL